MSTATLPMEPIGQAEEGFQYRALHTGAIAGIAFSVFTAMFTIAASSSSPEALIWVAFVNAPVLTVCLWSVARIRRHPDLYTGLPLAQAGAAISLVFLMAGVGYGAYQYLTEVPEGYTRMSFVAMKPSELQERNREFIPPDIAALDGQKIFIRGYMRPDSVTVSRGIDRFLLVRDNNQCCFGDISTVKFYDQILVEMVGSRRVDYHEGIFRMGGTLKIEPRNIGSGSTRPVYSLRADYVQ